MLNGEDKLIYTRALQSLSVTGVALDRAAVANSLSTEKRWAWNLGGGLIIELDSFAFDPRVTIQVFIVPALCKTDKFGWSLENPEIGAILSPGSS